MGCGSDDGAAPFGPFPFPQLNNPLPPPAVLREFVITPNPPLANVSVRSIDLATGQTQFVATTATGLQPAMVKVNGARRTFYVANFGGGTAQSISGFSIATDGTTAPLPGSPYAGPTGSRNVHIHPSGNFLYVSGTNALQSYRINADNSLTSLGTTATTVSPRNKGVFTQDGRFMHLPVFSGIQSFSIDVATGLATATTLTTITGAAPVNDVAISPDGTLILANCQVAGANNDIIAPFNVAPAGALTARPVNNLTFDVGLGEFARNAVYYVGDVTDANNRLFGFTTNNAGLLTSIAGSPFNAPGGGSQAAIDKTDQFVFTAANGNSMSVSKKLADNTLQLSPGSPITTNINQPFVFDFFLVAIP